MVRATTVVAATAATALAGLAAYALYFDYKRRNDPSFRKKLRKEQKRLLKASKVQADKKAAEDKAELSRAIEEVKKENFPTGVDEKEKYFMEHVAIGEQLFAQGQHQYVPAAISFYKALKVYPAPVELIMIYQKAVPEAVFALIMQLVQSEVSESAGDASDVEDSIPPPSTSAPPATGGDASEDTKDSNEPPASTPTPAADAEAKVEAKADSEADAPAPAPAPTASEDTEESGLQEEKTAVDTKEEEDPAAPA